MKYCSILAVLFALVVFAGCEGLLSPQTKNSPPATEISAKSSSYFDTTPGKTIRYAITYPAGWTASSSKPSQYAVTFQEVNSTATVKFFLGTTTGSREASCFLTLDDKEVSYNGGNNTSISSLPMQRVKLPATFSKTAKGTWTVTSDWHGLGEYTSTPLATFTTAGKTYSDCMRIDFPTGKLDFTGQRGHGFYILAWSVGLVHYEAVLDEMGPLGAKDETIVYDAVSDGTLSPRTLSLRVVDASDAPIAGAFVDFGYGNGPSLTAGVDGTFTTPLYLPNGDSLGAVAYYTQVAYGKGLYTRYFSNTTAAAGALDLGDLKFAPPADTTAPSVTLLTPSNDATGVSVLTNQLQMTFNEPMASGYSFVSFGGTKVYPVTGKPAWSSTTTAVLPVNLKADTTYTVGLNSSKYGSFQDLGGTPLVPVVWTFTTGPAKTLALAPGTSTKADVIAELGRQPDSYVWNSTTYTAATLPTSFYLARYSWADNQCLSFLIDNSAGAHLVKEARIEGAGFVTLTSLGVGTTLAEALLLMGTPTATKDGVVIDYGVKDVLFKNVEGVAGNHYYDSSSKGVRVFFFGDKATAVYAYGGNATVTKN